MDVVLRTMTPQEFVARRAELVRDSADSLAAYLGLSVPEAEMRAEQATAASLPLGPQTRNQMLRTAEAGGTVVGWIWLSLPGTFFPDVAWVSDVEVDPPYRRQGYGRAIMQGAEVLLAERGIARAGLNVDGRNETARRLYDSLGYALLKQQWARALGDIPGSLEVEVTLGADGTATAGGREVGRVAYADHHRDRPGMGWISELEYDRPAHGAAIVAAVERELVRLGGRSVGLDVTGGDESRRRLVERLGFVLMSQQMEKAVTPL
jgi:mycothiol synthase